MPHLAAIDFEIANECRTVIRNRSCRVPGEEGIIHLEI